MRPPLGAEAELTGDFLNQVAVGSEGPKKTRLGSEGPFGDRRQVASKGR